MRPSDKLPLVSIVIPCYNGEKYVGEAIDSALAQTYANKEVIVIDDGSTDGSLDVIKSFGDRIRWETGPNRGGSAARNRGIELARGELIQFLDADDLLHPQKLERQVPLALETPDAIVYCDFVVEDIETGDAVEIPRRECDGRDPVVFAIQAERLSVAAPLHWKNKLLEVGGFDESLACCQEYDLHIRLACHGVKWRHMREVLYTVRRREGSVSHAYARILEQHPGILLRAHSHLKGSGKLPLWMAEQIAGKLAADARAALRLGLMKEARHFFQLARQIHPTGGLRVAYSRPTLLLRRLVGARLTEHLVLRKRNFRGKKSYMGDGAL
jgi:glycosyltransferase involved in cell wall biosynthesis